MAVLENRPSKTLGFLHVFFSENDFFNSPLSYEFWAKLLTPFASGAKMARQVFALRARCRLRKQTHVLRKAVQLEHMKCQTLCAHHPCLFAERGREEV